MSDPHPAPAAFSIGARLKGIGHALSGVGFLLRTQHNAWIHAGATVVAIVLSLVLRLSPADWRWIIAAIALVWAAEGFNTAIECVCDLVSPDYNILVKRAKDVGAAAVLWTAMAAAAIGLLTFWPYLHLRG